MNQQTKLPLLKWRRYGMEGGLAPKKKGHGYYINNILLY